MHRCKQLLGTARAHAAAAKARAYHWHARYRHMQRMAGQFGAVLQTLQYAINRSGDA